MTSISRTIKSCLGIGAILAAGIVVTAATPTPTPTPSPGISTSTPTPSPTGTPNPTIAAPVQTKPGSQIKVGVPAILPFKDGKTDKTVLLKVTLDTVKQGSTDDFSAFDEATNSQLVNYSPYYLSYTMEKVDKKDLVAGINPSVDLWPLYSDGTQAFTLRANGGKFQKCPSLPLSKLMDSEKADEVLGSAKVCVVGLVRTGADGSITGSKFLPTSGDYAKEPVVWQPESK